MNARGNAALIQEFLNGGAIFSLHDVQVKNMVAVQRNLRQHERPSGERGGVCRGMLISQRVPPVQVPQLYAQNRGLNRIEPRVGAGDHMFVLDLLAVVAQIANFFGDGRVVGGDDSPVTVGTEILAGIKTEGRRMSPRAGALARILCSMGLRCVFNQQQVVFSGDRPKSVPYPRAGRRGARA